MSSAIVSLVCCAIYITVGYFYLDNKLAKTKVETPSVPYSSEEPENAGVMVDINGKKTYFFLDFYYKNLTIIFDAENYIEDDTVFGYPIEHFIEGDYGLLADIVDLVGGIELENETEENLRYTGVQIVEILNQNVENSSFNREIIYKIIEKIRDNGFKKEDFLYIINNSETTLTVPICYYWADYMKELCGSVNGVN